MTDLNPQILTINNAQEAYEEILNIECTKAGAHLMKDKAVFKVIKLHNLDTKAANILKQTFLSKGGEVAVSHFCVDLSKPTSDVIIMATVHQYKLAIAVLKIQPFGLKTVADLLTKQIES